MLRYLIICIFVIFNSCVQLYTLSEENDKVYLKFLETKEDTKRFDGRLFRKFKQMIPDIISRWKRFKENITLVLGSAQDRKRFFIYAKNIASIVANNRKNLSFELGENEFTHLARDEYFQFLGIQSAIFYDGNTKETEDTQAFTRETYSINVDWRAEGTVNSIQNQGNCGSCYAFAAISTVETAAAIRTGKLNKFSEQAVVDCSSSMGNYGCNGGYISTSFQFMMKYPMVAKLSYPYTQKVGKCIIQMDTKNAIVSNYVTITGLNEAAFVDGLKRNSIAVAIDAHLDSFRFYKSGIYQDTECSKTVLNHAVVVVGGKSSGTAHYIVRNSYGISWGDKGYFKLPMYTNQCGLLRMPSYPVLK